MPKEEDPSGGPSDLTGGWHRLEEPQARAHSVISVILSWPIREAVWATFAELFGTGRHDRTPWLCHGLWSPFGCDFAGFSDAGYDKGSVALLRHVLRHFGAFWENRTQ